MAARNRGGQENKPAKRDLPQGQQEAEAAEAEHLMEVLQRHPERLVQIVRESFSGPLPHPSVLEDYEKVMPGLSERIVAMAEREQRHRHKVERRIVNLGPVGQLLGFILGLVALVASIHLIQEGHDIAGIATVLMALATLTGALIFGGKKKAHED